MNQQNHLNKKFLVKLKIYNLYNKDHQQLRQETIKAI